MKYSFKFFLNSFIGLTALFSLSDCGKQDGSSSYNLLSDPVSVSMGDLHTCAAFSTGLAQCWGYNREGQLGNLSHVDSLVPVNVSAFSGAATAVTTTSLGTCAIINSGVQCWGDSGILGNGSSTNSDTAVQVQGLTSGVTAITNGQSAVCALVNGGVQCWGNNGSGTLGNGTLTNSTTPVAVLGLSSGVDKIASGESNHVCAVSSGAVKCWGRGLWGELGNGSAADSSTPVSVSNLSSGVSDIIAGRQYSCALLSNGSVKCWGRNSFGQLGDGNTDDSLVPVAVTNMDSGVTQLAGGGHHVCAIKSNELYCWGSNGEGQLGDGTNSNHSTPTLVAGFTGLTLVTAGRTGTCAVKSGKLYCWGNNLFGQLGDGTSLSRSTPTGVYAEAFSASPLLPLKNFFHWIFNGWLLILHWLKL